MDVVVYRPVEITDATELLFFMKSVLKESSFLRFTAGEFNMSREMEEGYITNFMMSTNSLMLLAIHQSEVIGLGTIEGSQLVRYRHNGEYGIVVKKKWWNKGIARELTNRLFEWARKNEELKIIRLHVDAGNSNARSFYERYGFTTEGIMKDHIYKDGQYSDTVLMAIELQQEL